MEKTSGGRVQPPVQSRTNPSQVNPRPENLQRWRFHPRTSLPFGSGSAFVPAALTPLSPQILERELRLVGFKGAGVSESSRIVQPSRSTAEDASVFPPPLCGQIPEGLKQLVSLGSPSTSFGSQGLDGATTASSALHLSLETWFRTVLISARPARGRGAVEADLPFAAFSRDEATLRPHPPSLPKVSLGRPVRQEVCLPASCPVPHPSRDGTNLPAVEARGALPFCLDSTKTLEPSYGLSAVCREAGGMPEFYQRPSNRGVGGV